MTVTFLAIKETLQMLMPIFTPTSNKAPKRLVSSISFSLTHQTNTNKSCFANGITALALASSLGLKHATDNVKRQQNGRHQTDDKTDANL